MDDRTRYHFSFREIIGIYEKDASMEYAQKVKNGEWPYLVICLPTDQIRWAVDGYHRSMTHMSFTILKKVSFTPAKFTKPLFGKEKLVSHASLIVETMDGRRMEAFEPWMSPYKDYKGEQKELLVLSDAVFREIERNFVHPRLNMNNYTRFSYEVGEPGAWDKVYFQSFSYNREKVAELYGAWKESIPEQRKFFEDYFSRQDAEEREKQQKAQRAKIEAEEARKRYVNTFEQDFGKPQQQYNYFKCKKCGTNCRVPANGKNLQIKCRCGNEFTIFSPKK